MDSADHDDDHDDDGEVSVGITDHSRDCITRRTALVRLNGTAQHYSPVLRQYGQTLPVRGYSV